MCKKYYFAGVLLLFMLLNPSRTQFISYLHKNTTAGSGRVFNGLIASVYSNRYSGQESFYIGILGNFIKIN